MKDIDGIITHDDPTLCGTCPDIPYNIATHFCAECNENVCNDCKRNHRIFRLTRDHIIFKDIKN